MTPRERVDMAAIDLFASAGRPVTSDLKIEFCGPGSALISPEPPKLIYSASPLVLYTELDGSAETVLNISWMRNAEPKTLQIPVNLVKGADAETVFALQGSRRITDAESQLIDAPAPGRPGQRESTRHSRLLEELSRKYGLASSAMSLVAVVKRKGDQKGVVPKTLVVPVGVPRDTAFDSYFNVNCLSAPAGAIVMDSPAIERHMEPQIRFSLLSPRESKVERTKRSRPPRTPAPVRPLSRPVSPVRAAQSTDEILIKLATRLESDGGMPGSTDEQRWIASAIPLTLPGKPHSRCRR